MWITHSHYTADFWTWLAKVAPVRVTGHGFLVAFSCPPLAPARGPPTGRDDLVQVHDDRDAIQASPDDLPVIDIRSL